MPKRGVTSGAGSHVNNNMGAQHARSKRGCAAKRSSEQPEQSGTVRNSVCSELFLAVLFRCSCVLFRLFPTPFFRVTFTAIDLLLFPLFGTQNLGTAFWNIPNGSDFLFRSA